MAKDGFTAKVHDALSDPMNLPAEFLSFLPQYIAQNPVSTLDHGTGYEIGYDEITAPVAVTSASEAAPTTIITCAEHSFDGNLVLAEVYFPYLTPSVGGSIGISLYEGSTELAAITSNLSQVGGTYLYRFTPSAGTHTYTVGGYDSGGAGSAGAGPGGTTQFAPAFIRFTKV